jgi:hypothetical protein
MNLEPTCKYGNHGLVDSLYPLLLEYIAGEESGNEENDQN